MASRCISGKFRYLNEELAIDALLELWVVNDYKVGQGPVNVYRCEDCGDYHLTSKGPMNEKLSAALASPGFKLRKEGKSWENRLKKK